MKHIFLFLFFFFTASAYGQHKLSGSIQDQNKEPLTGSTVVLLDTDSTMISFALADEKGQFVLTDVDTGQYILQVSFISYANYSQPLKVDGTTVLDPILMQESSEVLQEVTINAEHIPLGIRGDTLSYNVAAFQTRPNATVEDLLKQLPGIEVDRSGSIKAQGEKVDNVLVDGKEFFGSNPKMATKNLEAESVEKVEVYDKKSEIAEFTGVDDGQDERTINLKLKEDHKRGGFGRIEAHGGLEGEYRGKVNYYRYTPSYQASALVSTNNINQNTFSFNDRIDFMGGFMNAFSGGGGAVIDGGRGVGGQGVNTSLSAGINFNAEFTPKFSIRSHYLHTSDENVLTKKSDIQGFGNNFEYTNLEEVNANDSNKEHALNSRLRYKFNPFFEISMQNNFSFDEAGKENLTQSLYSSALNSGSTSSDVMQSGKSWMYKGNALIKNKFKKKGRSLITNLGYDTGEQSSEDLVINQTRLTLVNNDLYQRQEFLNPMTKFTASTKYTEPLGNKFYLGLDYNISKNREKPLKEYYDREAESWVLNDVQSGVYYQDYMHNRAGFSIKRNTKNFEWQVGLRAQVTNLFGELPELNTRIEGVYKNVLPTSYLLYEPRGGHMINMSYTTAIDAPRLQQLMPQVDNQIANYEYVGNPDLEPAYNNNIHLSYNFYDNFSFTHFWARSSTTISNNRILNSVEVDEKLFRKVTPVNTDRYLSENISVGFSQPARPLGIVYNISASAQFSAFDNFINGMLDDIKRTDYNLNLSIRNKKQKVIAVEAGIGLNQTKNRYKENTSFDQKYHQMDLFFNTSWDMGKKWTLTSDISHNTFSQEQFGDDPSFTLWNASLSKLFFEDKLEVKINAHDILNENIGFNRQVGTSTIRQSQFNNISRFVTLGLSYKIGKSKRRGIVVTGRG